jgi:hypothetical protein
MKVQWQVSAFGYCKIDDLGNSAERLHPYPNFVEANVGDRDVVISYLDHRLKKEEIVIT